MADDGSVNIDTKIDSSGIESGLDKIANKLKSVADNKILKGLTNINLGFGAIKESASLVTGAVKKVGEAIKECTEAYKVQQKADIALTQAAKNNPYLTGAAVEELKNFASQIENTAEIADSETVSLMAQLASAGRTQEQIEKIIKAASDVAAAGTMDFDSAVKVLNKTFQGSAGILDKSIAGIDGLTDAELKAGKAIDVVAEKYKGQAESSTDSTIRLANAWTNYKEAIGKDWNTAVSPMQNYFAKLIQGWADAKKAKSDYNAATDAIAAGKRDAADYKIILDNAKSELESLKETYAKYKDAEGIVYDEDGNYLNAEQLKQQISAQEQYTKDIQRRYNAINKQEKDSKTAAETTSKGDDALSKATDDIISNREELAKQIEQIKIKAQLEGKQVDQQEILNAEIESYISLIQKVGTLGSTEEKARISAIASQKDKTDKITQATQLTQQAQGMVENQSVELTPEQQYMSQYAAAQDMYAKINALSEEDVSSATKGEMTKSQLLYQLYDTECDLADKAAQAHKKADEDEVASKKAATQEMIDLVNNYTQQANQIAQSAAQLALTQVKTQSDAEIAELEDKHDQGLISDEDYEKQKEEIEKDAAEKQYKIQMWAWTASVLAATANIAEGMTKALAQSGPLGIVTGALVAAAGAVQIASLIASKPVPPSYATGGIVQGTSYTGDRVAANVNSGEMILNAKQQRALWNTANGKNGGSGSNIIVNNSASNIVSAQPQITEDGITSLIDIRVKESIKKGRYSKELAAANNSMTGTVYPT